MESQSDVNTLKNYWQCLANCHSVTPVTSNCSSVMVSYRNSLTCTIGNLCKDICGNVIPRKTLGMPKSNTRRMEKWNVIHFHNSILDIH